MSTRLRGMAAFRSFRLSGPERRIAPKDGEAPDAGESSEGSMSTSPNDLELISLTKRYGETVAVDAIDHHFKAGTYACLLGPSGCGKSSTLRMIAGHETVSGGTIILCGREIAALPPASRGTAMMFQNYALFPHLSVLDNVAFSLKMKGVETAERHRAARDMLDLVDMADYADRRPAQLSGEDGTAANGDHFGGRDHEFDLCRHLRGLCISCGSPVHAVRSRCRRART